MIYYVRKYLLLTSKARYNGSRNVCECLKVVRWRVELVWVAEDLGIYCVIQWVELAMLDTFRYIIGSYIIVVLVQVTIIISYEKLWMFVASYVF